MDDYTSKRAESYLEAQTQSFYSREDVKRVCRAGRLPPHQAAEISDSLENAAREWLENSKVENKNADRVKDDLSRLAKAAKEFSEALGDTTRDAWDDVFEASRHPRFAYQVSLSVEAEDDFIAGPISLRVDDPKVCRTVADLSISDLQQVATVLGELSMAGLFELRLKGRGRRESYALKTWVRRMFDLWDSKTRQPFTAGRLKGVEATTAASAFCIEAFRVIDPAMPPQRIHTEMRKLIAWMNRFRRSQKK